MRRNTRYQSKVMKAIMTQDSSDKASPKNTKRKAKANYDVTNNAPQPPKRALTTRRRKPLSDSDTQEDTSLNVTTANPVHSSDEAPTDQYNSQNSDATASDPECLLRLTQEALETNDMVGIDLNDPTTEPHDEVPDAALSPEHPLSHPFWEMLQDEKYREKFNRGHLKLTFNNDITLFGLAPSSSSENESEEDVHANVVKTSNIVYPSQQ